MPGKLTKAELSREIARNCGATLKEARGFLEIILDAIVGTLSGGGRVEIRGFGSFTTRIRKARIGRNPKTGALVKVPSKRVVHFRVTKHPSAFLLERVTASRT